MICRSAVPSNDWRICGETCCNFVAVDPGDDVAFLGDGNARCRGQEESESEGANVWSTHRLSPLLASRREQRIDDLAEAFDAQHAFVSVVRVFGTTGGVS